MNYLISTIESKVGHMPKYQYTDKGGRERIRIVACCIGHSDNAYRLLSYKMGLNVKQRGIVLIVYSN